MIVVVSGVRGDTRRYRTFHPYQQLKLAEIPCLLSHVTDPSLLEKMQNVRVLILHRAPMDRWILKLINRARQQSALVLVDVDDLTFDPQAFRWINSPDFADPVRRRIYQADMLRQRATIDASDGVLASTGFLADQVRQLGKPVWIHRNAFSLEMFQESEQVVANAPDKNDRVVIGYASGTPTHNRDFELVRPALLEVLAAYPNTDLWLVGPLNPGDGFEPFGARVRRIPFVPWRKLPLLISQFDINLAPLVVDNPFSQSKSEIKYMEAGMVKVPTVASPTDAFCYAVKHGENGFLAGSAQEWSDSLASLVSDPNLRREVGERSYQHVKAAYHPVARSRELVHTLNAVHEQFRDGQLFDEANRPAGDPAGCALPQALEIPPTYLQRGIYSLRYRGIGVLLGEMWIYLRRLLAPVFPFKKV